MDDPTVDVVRRVGRKVRNDASDVGRMKIEAVGGTFTEARVERGRAHRSAGARRYGVHGDPERSALAAHRECGRPECRLGYAVAETAGEARIERDFGHGIDDPTEPA